MSCKIDLLLYSASSEIVQSFMGDSLISFFDAEQV